MCIHSTVTDEGSEPYIGENIFKLNKVSLIGCNCIYVICTLGNISM